LGLGGRWVGVGKGISTCDCYGNLNPPNSPQGYLGENLREIFCRAML